MVECCTSQHQRDVVQPDGLVFPLVSLVIVRVYSARVPHQTCRELLPCLCMCLGGEEEGKVGKRE